MQMVSYYDRSSAKRDVLKHRRSIERLSLSIARVIFRFFAAPFSKTASLIDSSVDFFISSDINPM